MSDLSLSPGRPPGRTRQSRQDIVLPDGETLTPRVKFANSDLGISERTAVRMNLPTTYIGSVAYVARNASLRIVAEHVARRNQPQQRRRSRAATVNLTT
jgi:hypothetical protein